MPRWTLLVVAANERTLLSTLNRQAINRYEERLALLRNVGDRLGVADTLVLLGEALVYHGEVERARVVLEEHRALRRELGEISGSAYAPMQLGLAVLAQAQYAEAKALFLESLETPQVQPNRHFAVVCLEQLARVAAAEQDLKRAVRIFGAAAALRKGLGMPLSRAERHHYYEHTITLLCDQLGNEAFAAAWAEGRAM